LPKSPSRTWISISTLATVPDPASLAVSAAALVVSAGTAWLTLLRSGQLKMTQPTLFYLGPDGGGPPKVYVRALLYSTGKRGILIENMYVALRRAETRQNFSIWVVRENGHLSRGSGLFVDHDGTALDHHFLLPSDGTAFEFGPGDYTIDVYAKLVRSPTPTLLRSITATLSPEVANEARSSRSGVFFDWGPDLGRYHANTKPIKVRPDDDLLSIVLGPDRMTPR
jgi:hypothetical protein